MVLLCINRILNAIFLNTFCKLRKSKGLVYFYRNLRFVHVTYELLVGLFESFILYVLGILRKHSMFSVGKRKK